MPTSLRPLDQMPMAELIDRAHEAGLDVVAHLSTPELIEAIEQQRETDRLVQGEDRRPDGSILQTGPRRNPV